ncbi:MAG TPA: hypothetical protein VM555_07135 [Tahibacter sp.]|nr:hypothetical protein [Tahibacter sp.]
MTFSEATTDLVTGDVALAGATTATVTGGPSVYNVAATGMTVNGTVTVSVAADAAGNLNIASICVDNAASPARRV